MPDNNSPVFIVGTPRSGTTLTANILGRHSRIFMSEENHFFEDIYAHRSNLGNPANSAIARQRIFSRLSTMYERHNQAVAQLRINKLFSTLDRESACASWMDYKNVLSWIMELQAREMDKPRWGNNTPKDVFYIDEIMAFYPDAKILVCIRDPRDFVLSYKYRWQVTTEDHKNRLKSLYHPVITSLLWKSTVKRIPKIKAIVPAENMLIIPYESLVLDSEAVVQKICSVIGEEYEAAMLDITTHNSSEKQQQQQGIFSTSIGKWRTGLPPEEVNVVQQITHTEMNKYDYESEKLSASQIKVVCIYLMSFYALIKALYSNRRNRGPLWPYLSKRISSLRRG